MENKSASDGQNSVAVETEDVSILTPNKPARMSGITWIKKHAQLMTNSYLKIVVFILFLVIIITIPLIFHFGSQRDYELEVARKIRFKEDTHEIIISNTKREVLLTGQLGTMLPAGQLPYACYDVYKGDGTKVCLGWKNQAIMRINYHQEGTTSCTDISWRAEVRNFILEDCYNLGTTHWYGMGNMYTQRWPLERSNVNLMPYVTGSVHNNGTIGSVLERYWLAAIGVAIFVKGDVPLYVSFNAGNNKKLCLRSQHDNLPYVNPEDNPFLNYTVCTDHSLLEVHAKAIHELSSPPGVTPGEPLFRKPIWSTWAFFKQNIRQQQVVDYIKRAVNSFKASLLVIGDPWESKYGSLEFDVSRFPDPSNMTQEILKLDVAPSLWIHPFKNHDTASFSDGVTRDYVLHDAGGEAPGLVKWYNGPETPTFSRGTAAAVDFTNQQAVQWFKSSLQSLNNKFNINSFMFSGGEVGRLPFLAHAYTRPANPDDYTQAYVINVAATMGNMIMIQAATQSQNAPVFLTIHDKSSSWGHDNGLRSVIPTVLTYGILGYPFVMSPEIGGTSFDGGLPDRELYIRWLELSAFLPAMHFSIPPWAYDEEVQNIARKMINLHENVVHPVLWLVAEEAATTSKPIIRPLWWIAPRDLTAQVIEDEFLIGNNMLVAPVVEQRRTLRNIYLPAGVWYDELRREAVTGGKWLNNYPVELDEVPYFTTQS